MLYVQGRKVVVVGHGDGAEERATRLREAGAIVNVVTPAQFSRDALTETFAVLAMADSHEQNARTVAVARAAGCLTYAHDFPAESDFAMPALARRGPLQIAIATDGVAPALSRRIRQELSRLLDAAGTHLDDLIAKLAAIRARESGDSRRAALSKLTAGFHIRGHIEIRESDDTR